MTHPNMIRVDWDEAAHPNDATPAFREAFEFSNAIFVPERRRQVLTLKRTPSNVTAGLYLRGRQSGATGRVVGLNGLQLSVALTAGRFREGEPLDQSASSDGIGDTSLIGHLESQTEITIAHYPIRNLELESGREIVCESKRTTIRGVDPFSTLLVPAGSMYDIRIWGGYWLHCGRVLEVADRTTAHPVFERMHIRAVRPRLRQTVQHSQSESGLSARDYVERGPDRFEIVDAYKLQRLRHAKVTTSDPNNPVRDVKGQFENCYWIELGESRYPIVETRKDQVTVKVPQTVDLPSSGALREFTRAGAPTGDQATMIAADPPHEFVLELQGPAEAAELQAGDQLTDSGGQTVSVASAEAGQLDSGAAFRFSDALKGVWRDCRFDRLDQDTGPPEIGIELVRGDRCTGGQSNACTIESCYFFSCGKHAVVIDGSLRESGGINSLTIRDCIIEQSGESGIFVGGNCRAVFIQNCYFEMNGNGSHPDIDISPIRDLGPVPAARSTNVVVENNYFAPGPSGQLFRVRNRDQSGLIARCNSAVAPGVFCRIEGSSFPVILESNRLQGAGGSYREHLFEMASTFTIRNSVSWSSVLSDTIRSSDPHNVTPHVVHAGDVVSSSNARVWGLLRFAGPGWTVESGYNIASVAPANGGMILVKTLEPIPAAAVILAQLDDEQVRVQGRVSEGQILLGQLSDGNLTDLPIRDGALCQFVVFGLVNRSGND